MTDYGALARRFAAVRDAPAHPMTPDLTHDEYRLRLALARERMAVEGLDALVVTSSQVGAWFTGPDQPDEWHDQCGSRANLLVLSSDDDRLYLAPTVGGERLSSVRRATWVTTVQGLVEASRWPRSELWEIEQVPAILGEMRLTGARLGFELGDHMTLGLSVLDFLRLGDLLPNAEIVDGAPVVRWLMSHLTSFEVDRLRRACQAGVWIHDQVPRLLRAGQTEAELADSLADAFAARFDRDYAYDRMGSWAVGNPSTLSDPYHRTPSDRVYGPGDLVFRGWSGAGYRGYVADIDRNWFVGRPPTRVIDLYRMAWEANRAMAERLAPGVTCADVYAAGAQVERRHGRPRRLTGRTGHGYRNTGGLSISPGCRTVLEPGMVVSVEPIYQTEHGMVDLEDQYLITPSGAACLHEPAPEQLPLILA